MSITIRVLLAATILFAATLNARAEMDEKEQEAAQAVNAACKADADTVGCYGEIVGEGLLECLHAYKQTHKEFEFSRGCHEAMKQFRKDRKAAKS